MREIFKLSRSLICIITALLAATQPLDAKAKNGNVYVALLGAFPSHKAALNTFDKLQQKWPEVFNGRQPFVHKQKSEDQIEVHRLRIGPLTSEINAISLCREISQIGHPDCKVVDAFELAQRQPGYFGDLQLQPLEDGTNMKVLKEFGFTDSQARVWEVPIGSTTDGASIPRVFWSIVGSPFTGKYLRAAVIHDRYVASKNRSWAITHNAFYDAMIASGVDNKTAMTMWAAVYRFGPRWAEGEAYCGGTCAGGAFHLDYAEVWPEYVDSVFRDIRLTIERRASASREDIEQYINTKTYYPDDTRFVPYPARMKGFVSGTIFDGEGDPNFKPSDWTVGKGNRRYVDGLASERWPNYGNLSADRSGGGWKVPDLTYKIIGIASNDTLNVRSGPSSKHPIIAKLRYDQDGIVIKDRCTTLWCKITSGNIEGWVNTTYLEWY